jgi:hypothetical protein
MEQDDASRDRLITRINPLKHEKLLGLEEFLSPWQSSQSASIQSGVLAPHSKSQSGVNAPHSKEQPHSKDWPLAPVQSKAASNRRTPKIIEKESAKQAAK